MIFAPWLVSLRAAVCEESAGSFLDCGVGRVFFGLAHAGREQCVPLACVVLTLLRQAMKGTWWMPWHQEPMKDVGACDKPWGVGNQAVIRGCPNGETQHESCRVTCT
jgi:hypothetical protein